MDADVVPPGVLGPGGAVVGVLALGLVLAVEVNSPILGPDGELAYILHSVDDVTEFVRLEQLGTAQLNLTAELRMRNTHVEEQVRQRSLELREAKEAADRANPGQSDFLSKMSHELRTPLNAILGFGQLLQLEELGREHAEGVDHILRAGQQRLRQVLLSLASNAVKYGRHGGRIRVACQAAGAGRVAIVVADDGDGIPADKMARLFKPSDRLGAEQSEIQGTGMGLALSKGLVEAMGGRLTADSVVGEGTKPLDVARFRAVVEELLAGVPSRP